MFGSQVLEVAIGLAVLNIDSIRLDFGMVQKLPILGNTGIGRPTPPIGMGRGFAGRIWRLRRERESAGTARSRGVPANADGPFRS